MKLRANASKSGACHDIPKGNFYRKSQSDWRWLTPSFQADPVFVFDSEIPKALRAPLFKTNQDRWNPTGLSILVSKIGGVASQTFTAEIAENTEVDPKK
ncbi:MAG TPA: hypothetical protein VK785_04295 [Opitutaceae bacterium]|nr:hypothetical protein [Opitutaceae bacterium]